MKLIMCFYLKGNFERIRFCFRVLFLFHRIVTSASSSMTCFAFFKNAWNLSFLERKFSSVREKKCDLLLPVLCILYCSWNIERINFAQYCYLSLVCRLCCRVISIFSSGDQFYLSCQSWNFDVCFVLYHAKSCKKRTFF